MAWHIVLISEASSMSGGMVCAAVSGRVERVDWDAMPLRPRRVNFISQACGGNLDHLPTSAPSRSHDRHPLTMPMLIMRNVFSKFCHLRHFSDDTGNASAMLLHAMHWQLRCNRMIRRLPWGVERRPVFTPGSTRSGTPGKSLASPFFFSSPGLGQYLSCACWLTQHNDHARMYILPAYSWHPDEGEIRSPVLRRSYTQSIRHACSRAENRGGSLPENQPRDLFVGDILDVALAPKMVFCAHQVGPDDVESGFTEHHRQG
jgi:hypothetical protein